MHFQDPALQYSFCVPLGWAYDWESSHLITVKFHRWDDQHETVSVRAMPTFAPPDATLDDWHAALQERAFAPELLPATRLNAGSSPAALAEAHADNPGPVHRRLMIVRGTRLDVLLEHRIPEPSAGPRLSDVLRVIGESLDVPTNRFLPEFVPQDGVINDLNLASEAMHREAWMDAVAPAMRALQASQGVYLYSIVENTPLPEIPAVVYQLNAMFKLAQASGSILFLRHAEHLALRALYTLRHLPFMRQGRRQQLGNELSQALEVIAELHASIIRPDVDPSTTRWSPGLQLALWRSEYLDVQARKGLGEGALDMAMRLCEAAIDDLLMVVSAMPERMQTFNAESVAPELAEKLRAAGATTPEQLAELSREIASFRKLTELTKSLRLLADLRLLSDDFVGAAEATQFVMPILDRLEQPAAMSFGNALEPLQSAPAQRAMALMAHASSLSDIGDPPSLEQAHDVLDDAETILDDLHEEAALRAQLCLMRASVLHAQRRLDGALDTIERGLRAAENQPDIAALSVPELKTIKSQFLLNAGDLEAAKHVALEVVSVPEADNPRALRYRASHYLNLAIIQMRLGENADAADSLKSALHRAIHAAPFSEAAYRILMVSSRLFNTASGDLYDPAVADQLNLAALANLDARYARINSDAARIGFDETGLHRQSYEDMIQRLIDVGDWEEAAIVADRSRARALNRLIAPPAEGAGALQVASQDPPQLHGMERQEAFRMAGDYVIRNADALISRQGVPQAIDAGALRRIASETGTVCLFIQPVHGRIALIVIRPDGHIGGNYSPDAAHDLHMVLQTVYVHIEQPQETSARQPGVEEAFDSLLKALWSSLIAPVSNLLGHDTPLTIVPYREFALVPFALLRDEAGQSLIDYRPIAVTPSLAILGGLRAKGPWRRTRPARAYIAGDPAFNPRFRFDRLPGAKAEAETVANILKGFMAEDGDMRLRLEADAHEESYRREARGCDLVHLACHAQLAEPAYRSRLILAPFEHQDGLLMAEEVTDVRLNDALVFLGACQTGQGRVTADGVVGLGRSFMEAGARAVVLSLWSVQDQATRAFTTHFYESLADASAPPSTARALQQAMLKTRDDLKAGRIVVDGEPLAEHPRYWAPFFILGDAFSARYVA